MIEGFQQDHILLAGKNSSDSSTEYDNFMNFKNRCDLWKVSAGAF